MAPSPASSRRRGPGATPRPRPGSNAPSRSDIPRWLWVVVAGVLLLTIYLVWSRRAQAAALNTSGTPGPDLTGSRAQQPNGGAASIPGSLPNLLVDQPNALTDQVQTTDTSSAESPQALAQPSDLSQSFATPSSSFGYGYNGVTAGVDPAQAFAAAVLGITPQPNMTLNQLNAQLAAQGLATQSYPSTITASQPTSISSASAPSPVLSDLQRHFVYGRDPDA